jgi:hypothetical protein
MIVPIRWWYKIHLTYNGTKIRSRSNGVPGSRSGLRIGSYSIGALGAVGHCISASYTRFESSSIK